MNITDYFPDYIEVGYAKKATGIQGRLKIHVEERYVESLAKARNCFFLLKGCMVPYFIGKSSAIEDSVVKFDGIQSPEETKVIAGKSIYLQEQQIQSGYEEIDELQFSFLQGLELVDVNTEDVIGVVTLVEEYPEQEIATISSKKNKEFLLPVNEYNFRGLNEEETKAYFEIPDGLLDL